MKLFFLISHSEFMLLVLSRKINSQASKGKPDRKANTSCAPSVSLQTLELKKYMELKLFFKLDFITIVVDHAIAIHVSFFNHIIDLLLSELLTQIHHDSTKLRWRNQSIVVLVKHPIKNARIFIPLNLNWIN